MKKAIVIGSGFAGLSAASFMARDGWQVTVLEKQSTAGGRARSFSAEGFTFDMGPSWYWMPDVFERYFKQFGFSVKDFYYLQRLDPSYRIYWHDEPMDIPADYDQLKKLFESIEAGSGVKLDKFLKESSYKYETGINKLVYKPGLSLSEFADLDLAKGLLKLDVFNSMKSHVQKHFRHPKLRQLLEFPVLFLGALSQHIPALYSLMNYADIKLGTWYPEGGMYSIVKAMQKVAEGLGVTFRFNHNVNKVNIEGNSISSVEAEHNGIKQFFESDVVICGADYHFFEQSILPEKFRTYTKKYWEKRVMAPSCLLFYVGINKKLKAVTHHSLFFDVDFEKHGKEIYETAEWPEEPLFYVCTPSVTDCTVAPHGEENLFFLIPVAAGLKGDTEELRNKYFDMIISRFENLTGEIIKENIIYKKSYAITNFVNDYNSFKGNAYGLANTLMQTSIMKPSLKSKKVGNLYFTGQLTVPGPGVPPSLISGEVTAKTINTYFKNSDK
ncbi:MAG: phytoene desaturase family protein [Ferruginibacter sp.]